MDRGVSSAAGPLLSCVTHASRPPAARAGVPAEKPANCTFYLRMEAAWKQYSARLRRHREPQRRPAKQRLYRPISSSSPIASVSVHGLGMLASRWIRSPCPTATVSHPPSPASVAAPIRLSRPTIPAGNRAINRPRAPRFSRPNRPRKADQRSAEAPGVFLSAPPRSQRTPDGEEHVSAPSDPPQGSRATASALEKAVDPNLDFGKFLRTGINSSASLLEFGDA